MSYRLAIVVALLASVLPLTIQSASATTTYTFEMFNYPDASFTYAWGINNAQEIVGGSAHPELGFLRSGETFTSIEVPGTAATFPRDLNDVGQVVGFYQLTSRTDPFIGFVLDRNTWTFTTIDPPVSTPPGARKSTMVQGINNDGYVVGSVMISDDADFREVIGFVYDGSSYSYFTVPSTYGAYGTNLQDINDHGQIVGYYDTNPDPFHLTARGFLLSDGILIRIDVPGAEWTYANGINNDGQIVGDYYGAGDPDVLTAGYIYDDGVYTTIELSGETEWFSRFNSINDDGYIAGYVSNSTHDAFVGIPVVDSDDDGISDEDERAIGTDPFDADTDDDGLLDGDEVARGTDPTRVDTDGDGLSDGDEVARGTDPIVADTDGDGIADGDEVAAGSDPLDSDVDDDGIPDGSDPDTVGEVVAGLADSVFLSRNAEGHRTAILSRLEEIEGEIAAGDYAEAISMLEDLRLRVDGCGTTADSNDWIVDCTDQLEVRHLIDVLIANLRS